MKQRGDGGQGSGEAEGGSGEREGYIFSFHFHQATFQWPGWGTKQLSLERWRHWDGNSHDNAHFSLSFVICGKWSGSLIHGKKCLHIREVVVSSKRKGAVWQKLHALQKDVIHPEPSLLTVVLQCVETSPGLGVQTCRGWTCLKALSGTGASRTSLPFWKYPEGQLTEVLWNPQGTVGGGRDHHVWDVVTSAAGTLVGAPE